MIFAWQSRYAGILLALLCALALTLAGCDGAKGRQAKYASRGKEYLAQGKFDKARVEFRNALQVAPNDADLRYYNGLVDEKLGNIQEAVEYYRSVDAVNSDHVGARANLGRLLDFAGLSDEALAEVNPALSRHPDNVELLVVRAVALQQKKNTTAALADAQRAVSLEPNNEHAIATLAGIEMNSGDGDRALKLIEDAVQRFPDSPDLWGVLVRVYMDRKDVEGAERTLLALMGRQPSVVAYRLQLAQLYAMSNRVDDAERILRAATKELPLDDGAKTSLVEFLWARRGHDVAEAELERMVAAAPGDRELRLRLANLYEQTGDATKAQAAYRDVIQRDGTNSYGLRARDSLAAIYTAKNDMPAAEKLISEVLAQNPADYDALVMRAYHEYLRGAAEAAIADLRRILRDQPNAVPVLADLARAYIVDGEPQLAEETARHAVELDPSSMPARLGLARTLIATGKFDESRTILNELQKQRPDDIAVADLQYRASVAMHDFKGAQSAANDLVRLQPTSPIGPVYLGAVAENTGRIDEALADYHRALDLQPGAVDPLTAIVRLLERAKRFDEADRVLDEHGRRFPNSSIVPILRGEILVARGGHLPQAEAAFRVAVAQAPKWWSAYHGLALVELARNNPSGAALVLHDAALHAEFSESQRLELAALLTSAGKYGEAIEQCEIALKLNSKSRAAAADLALLLVLFRTDEASLSRATALVQSFGSSDDWQLLDAFGWVQFKNGDFAAALPALEKAAAAQPDASQVRFHLGMTEMKLGQGSQATQNLSAALSHGTRFPGSDEARAVLAQLRSGRSDR